MDYFFDPQTFTMEPKGKFKQNLTQSEILVFCQIGIKYGHFDRLYTLLPWQIFEIMTNGLHFWSKTFTIVPNWMFKYHLTHSEILIFYQFGIKNGHFYNLFTVLWWQIFEIMSNGLLFWHYNVRNVGQVGCKYGHFFSLYTAFRWQIFEIRSTGLRI